MSCEQRSENDDEFVLQTAKKRRLQRIASDFSLSELQAGDPGDRRDSQDSLKSDSKQILKFIILC